MKSKHRNTLVFMVDKSNQRVTQGNTKTEKQNFAYFEVNQLTMTWILQNEQLAKSFPCFFCCRSEFIDTWQQPFLVLFFMENNLFDSLFLWINSTNYISFTYNIRLSWQQRDVINQIKAMYKIKLIKIFLWCNLYA